MKSRHWFACGIVLLVLAGCRGAPAKPSLVRVRGTVTYKGNPVNGELRLVPPDKTKYPAASAIKEGAFDLRTFAGTTEPDGALPGKYTVEVDATYKDGQEKKEVPRRYADAGTSPKTVGVPSGGTDNLKIELTEP
jgi:hypothetical protein